MLPDYLPAPSVTNPSSVPKLDESAIIEAVRAGKCHRFEELVSAYQGRLMIGLYAMLGKREDAEDVAQEAFTTAYRRLSNFEGRSSFFTWLHRIAFNLAIDHRRRERRHTKATVSVEAIDNLAVDSKSDSPMQMIERQENNEGLYRAMANLDPQRRAVITLRDLQGLNYEEISDCLEIPVGTVRSRLHRARIELKEILQSQGFWRDNNP